MSPPMAMRILEGKVLAEVRPEEGPALRAAHTDRAIVDGLRDLPLLFGGGGQQRVLPERFGIEQEAVHVEDHGARGMRQQHPCGYTPANASARFRCTRPSTSSPLGREK